MIGKAKFKEIAGTSEAIVADRMLKRIEDKLNFDNRWNTLGLAETMLRLGRLTNSESEYLGRYMDWDSPFHGGVNWDEVPTNFLAACLELSEKRIFNTLAAVYPAPERRPVIETAEKDKDHTSYESFLAGDLTFDELAELYPAP